MLSERCQDYKQFEQDPIIRSTSRAGFSDWKSKAQEMGNYNLLSILQHLDSEPGERGKNAHHFIHDRLTELELPTQDCAFVSLDEFLHDPESTFARIPRGDYYFASVKPGTHLAHAEHKDEVIQFMQHYAAHHEAEGTREVFISHNGEAVMSGHIIVHDEGKSYSSITSEFTTGNFNAFHRGFHTPEISVRRSFLGNEWTFQGSLESAGDWRTNEQFSCFGGVEMSRLVMAQHIHTAISHIPHDGDFFLPGYYEVLFERTDHDHLRPTFIEAVIAQP